MINNLLNPFRLGAAPPPSGDPSMYLTVTGAATTTIQWCGQTWNLPTDTGVTKEVLPTNAVFTGALPTANASWSHIISSNVQLRLWRMFQPFTTTTAVYSCNVGIQVAPAPNATSVSFNASDYGKGYCNIAGTVGQIALSIASLGAIPSTYSPTRLFSLATIHPGQSVQQIPRPFLGLSGDAYGDKFNSCTKSDIIYEWNKGNNWA